MKLDVTSLYGRRATNRWERVSVGDVLERLKWSFPEKEAIVGWEGTYAHPENRRLSYQRADQKANQFAHALLQRGLKRGDRVLLFCANSVEAILAKIGTAKAGLVVTPINTMMAPDIVDYLIKLVEPVFSVVDAEFWPGIEGVFRRNGMKPDVTIPIGGEVVPGSQSFESFLSGKPNEEPEVDDIHIDDIWEILFTAGTTTMPKGVMLSHGYAYMCAYSYALSLTRGVHIENDLKSCSFLPVVFHTADQTIAFSAFLSGGTFILGRTPDPVAMAEAITREKVTALWAGSPLSLMPLADTFWKNRFRYDPGSLRVIVYGWMALRPDYAKRLKDMCGEDLVLLEIFGQTEAVSAHRFWLDKWWDKYVQNAPAVNYVGVPNPLLASAIMDDEGNLVRESGIPGESVYRSPAVMAGYYKDEEATKKAFQFGWFHSGDCCMYDEDGLAIMVDRYKDIIKSGGENVSSLRVESVLVLHPQVEKAAVIGLPHEKWGEMVTGIVVPKKGEAPAEEELISFCRERLAGYETPKKIIFVPGLPETVGGKVQKYKLREQFSGGKLV